MTAGSETQKFEEDDYYLGEDGYIVFTEKYHLKRGYCCDSDCRHCPWKDKPDDNHKAKDNKK